MRKQGFLSLLYTARWGSFFTFRDSESAGSGKSNMKSGSKNLRTAFFFRESSIFALRRTEKAAAMPFGGQKLRYRGHAAGGAHRRIQQTRQKNEATAPAARFRQQTRIRRHSEGTRHAGILRSVYIRTHDARDNCEIRPEICPDTRACADFLKFFKKISFSVQRKGKKYRLYNIRTLLCTSKCSASRAFLHPHTQNSHPIRGKPLNIRKSAHGLWQIRSDICKSCARFRASRIRYMQSRARP